MTSPPDDYAVEPAEHAEEGVADGDSGAVTEVFGDAKAAHLQIRHHLRGIGPLCFHVHSLPAIDIWKAIIAAGGNRHLASIPHLGTLIDVFPSATHTRWDYVFLQGFLCESLRDLGKNSGLGANIRLGGQQYTAADIVKLWAVMLNMGHMRGTFTAERCAHYKLSRHPELHDDLLELMEPPLRAHATRILDSEGWYDFHHILAWMRLSSNPRLKGTNWVAVALAYYDTESEKIRNLRQSFESIRRLAFVYLDSHCVSPYLRTDLPAAILSLRSTPTIARDFLSLGLPIADITDFMSRYLYDTVYLAPEASPIQVEALERLATQFEDKFRGLSAKKRRIALSNLQTTLAARRIHEPKYRFIARLEVGNPPFAQIAHLSDFTIYSHLKTKVTGGEFKIFVTRRPRNRRVFIDFLGGPSGTLPAGMVDAVRMLIQPDPQFPLAELRNLAANQPQVHAQVVQRTRASAARFVLDVLGWMCCSRAPHKCDLRVSRNGRSTDLAMPAVIDPAPTYIGRALSLAANALPEPERTNHAAEIAGLAAYFTGPGLRQRAIWIALAGPIVFRDAETHRDIAEFDGVAVGFRDMTISIVYIEVKGGRKKSGHPLRTRELHEKFSRCGLHGGAEFRVSEVNADTTSIEVRLPLAKGAVVATG